MGKTWYERALEQSVRLKGTKYEKAAALIAFCLINGKEPKKKTKALIEALEEIKI